MTFFHIKPAQRFDPALLLPRELLRSRRFETCQDARCAWIRNRERLVGDKFLCEAIGSVDWCAAGGDRCDLPLCPRCARRYRRWLSSRILRLLSRCTRAYMLTIYGGLFPRGELCEADIKLFHGRIRKRLRRAGFGRVVVIGGTEVCWRADLNCWLLHLHVVVLDPPAGAIERLREASEDALPGSPTVRTDTVRDPAKAATYVQKFLPIHHPGQRSGNRRPRGVGLPNREAREFSRFLLRHAFQDFLFLYGCRRRGPRIEVL